ncbi:MAG: hypothetical protein U9N86_04430 [Bacteroidota bacterium]|nr:hypothetical protein [Bacteroidota bacterium]
MTNKWLSKYYNGLIITVIIFFIAFIAVVFHYPIQIIDALSSEAVQGIGIKISVWRVIFEPFLGILLFYLRADQPILEFVMLLIWILEFYLLATIAVHVLRRENKLGKTLLKSVLVWLRRVPMVVIVWFGVLVFIIAMSLPANTISNDRENAVLINTHSHTEYSHDGIISQEGLQLWHGKHNFDAFFITDHNHHEKTMELVQAQRDGKMSPEPLIMIGEEFSGSNHMTMLGLKRNFITQGLSDQQVIDSTHDDNGVVIVAHWFDGERESIPFFIDLNVDGFEIANQGPESIYDRRIFDNIVDACTTNGLIMNGATDYHGYGSTCFVWNALDIPGWHDMEMDQKEEAILDVLRQKDMSKIKVLIYNDRKAFKRELVFFSPVVSVISYFRTLNFFQVLSWLIWMIIIQVIRLRFQNKKIMGRIKIGSLQLIEMLTFLSGFFMLFLGANLIHRATSLTEYNDIYSEYGETLLWIGGGSLLYLIALLLFEKRLRRSKSKLT